MSNEQNINPANDVNVPEIPKGYRPMNAAQTKLEVTQRPGYHRHWFRGTPERIARARQAGYDFVKPDQVEINNFDLGGDISANGNTDMGSRVSIVSGDGLDSTGQPSRMYLMECPIHLYEMSMAVTQEINDGIATAIRGGKIGSDQDTERSDTNSRYVKGAVPDLFNPNKRRS